MAISAASSPAHIATPPLPLLTSGQAASSSSPEPPPPATPATLKLKPSSSNPASLGPTRRELLAKGKEGSRRRQRWENDHFVSNPHFVAPTKADFAPGPLYPKRTVPYQYASLWDHPSFPRRTAPAPAAAGVGERVPRELRSRLKRSRGALALLEALEREVRDFLFSEPAEQPSPLEPDYSDLETDSLSCADGVTDSEEDEIVFVSRRERSGAGVATATAAATPATAVAGLGRASEKVVFKSREEEQGANFGRWLVHSIAGYYGIKSWSVTEGRPAVRYAYVAKPPRGASAERVPPKPLYLMV